MAEESDESLLREAGKFFFGCLNRHLNQVKTKKTEFLQLSVVRYVRKAERFRKVIFHYPCLLQQSA